QQPVTSTCNKPIDTPCSPLLNNRQPAFFFFLNNTAPTEIYTLSLHDALPIYPSQDWHQGTGKVTLNADGITGSLDVNRSEEHTSELQSRPHLVCRLLLEK